MDNEAKCTNYNKLTATRENTQFIYPPNPAQVQLNNPDP
jgi:hypothetical protein